jgi:hypothetical protein
VIDLDKFFWRPGLVATPRDQWAIIQERLVAEGGWIGNSQAHTCVPWRNGKSIDTQIAKAGERDPSCHIRYG